LWGKTSPLTPLPEERGILKCEVGCIIVRAIIPASFFFAYAAGSYQATNARD